MSDKEKPLIPHSPRKNGGPEIGIDLQDLAKKAVTYGPLRVFGETVLNLCLMFNDQNTAHIPRREQTPNRETPNRGKGGTENGRDIHGQGENLRGRSAPKKGGTRRPS